MSRNKHGYNMIPQKPKPVVKTKVPAIPVSDSFLDVMVDGYEFESLLHYQYSGINVVEEIRRSIKEISDIRKRPVLCYIANVVKPVPVSISIDDSDDLPFSELINRVPPEVKDIDLVLVTPGGSAQQVARFVNKLRPRFDNIGFILLNKCMSAGTIFSLSGNEIIMGKDAYIGPIDPQAPSKSGNYVPAQAIMTLVEDIRQRGEEQLKKGQQPSWADITILKNIDPKELGNAISASNYSINLVSDYLEHFKFRDWTFHSDGETPVTPEEKTNRAKEIAKDLCAHSKWKSHGHAISREVAWEVCRLKIVHPESITGLDRAMRRMWALFYWFFENTNAVKYFISENYCVIRNYNPPK